VEVFRNLMKNALDAMSQDGGVLGVSSRRLNERLVEVVVTDTGPGIPPEIRERIFHLGTTTKPGGSGFGLWWSRTFLRRLGGDIALENQGGKGCVFRVTLPISTT
jgi:signal transduction histidine kinase